MYKLGQGVTQNVTEALKLFMLDAEENRDCSSEYSPLHHIRDIYLESGDCAEAIKWCVIFISLLLYFGDKTTVQARR